MMTRGQSISLHLFDGTLTGIVSAEIINWTIHIMSAPRTQLNTLLARPELNRSGIYILTGQYINPLSAFGDSKKSTIYIGETDQLASRLKRHNMPENSGGKDFWDRVCIISSKDEHLTKGHIKYLEAALIESALQAKLCNIENSQQAPYINLPEAAKNDMESFLDKIRIILPVLGYDFLNRPLSRENLEQEDKNKGYPSPQRFVLTLPTQNIKAIAEQVKGHFFVLAQSEARGEWVGAGEGKGYAVLQQKPIDDGTLIFHSDTNTHLFTKDTEFNSPSAAAAVICGRSSNGRIEWKMEDKTHKTYADWAAETLDMKDQSNTL